jgi:hypothetical protein
MTIRKCATTLCAVVSAVAWLEASDSVRPAEALVDAMRRRGLDFVAARAPGEAGRYVAAMRIGDSQLYLVSARDPDPALVDGRLARGESEQIYRRLVDHAPPEDKLFVQDINGLGLRRSAAPDEAFDIVFVSGDARTAFHGDWAAQGLSRQAYDEAFARADAAYARALTILVEALRRPRESRPSATAASSG